MHQILYSSKATQVFTKEELNQLVDKAQVYNSKHEITGMLIYDHEVFTQVLEGDRCELIKLMEKIEADPRHYDIIILKDIVVEFRHYNDWMMGFACQDNNKLIKLKIA
jgi:hypothetical protein